MFVILIAAFLTVAQFAKCASFDDIPSEVLSKIIMDYQSTPKDRSLKMLFNTCKRWRAVVTEYIESLDAASIKEKDVMERLREFPITTNWNEAAANQFVPFRDSKSLTVTKDNYLQVDILSIDALLGDSRKRALKHIESQWHVAKSWRRTFKFMAMVAMYFSTSYFMMGVPYTWLSYLAIPGLAFCTWCVKQKLMEVPTSIEFDKIKDIIRAYNRVSDIAEYRIFFFTFLSFYMPINVVWGFWNLFGLSTVLLCILGIPSVIWAVVATFLLLCSLHADKTVAFLSKDRNILIMSAFSLLLERLFFW